MGILERYDQLSFLGNISVEKPSYKEVEMLPPIILPDDSVCITLADQSPECNGVVLVHPLRNYRRRSQALVLVPDLEVEIDKLIFDREEVEGCFSIL